MTRSSRLFVLWLLLVGAGCQKEEPARELTAGAHRLSIIVPDGWEYLDHGLEHLIRKEHAQISIQDLGPVNTPGYVAEVEAARELWRRGEVEAAGERIRRIQIPRVPGSTNQEHETFRELWFKLRKDRELADGSSMEQNYRQVLGALQAFHDIRLEDLLESSLDRLGHDERRDIATGKRQQIDGRSFLVVDTWDRLSHDYRHRHAFLINQGHLLVVRTKVGRFAQMEEPYDTLLLSLKVRVSLPGDGSQEAGL